MSYRKRVTTEAERAEVISDLKRVPIERGFNVSCTRRTRTHDQNDMMHGLLSCFERQKVTINGQAFDKDAWKAIFMNALGHDSSMLPTLDGSRFFAEGHRSSKLSVSEMQDLIEFIIAEGTVRGVDMSKYGIPFEKPDEAA